MQSAVSDEPQSCPEGFEMSTTIVADFVAGFIQGFTEHDDKADLEKCFADSPEFE